jgi:hypothetical protein
MLTFELVLIGLAIALDLLPLSAFMILPLSRRRPKRQRSSSMVGLVDRVALTVGHRQQPAQANTAPYRRARRRLRSGWSRRHSIRQRRKMGQPKKPKKPPKWQASVDNMSPWYAIGIAPLLQPWGLIAAGVATVTDAKLSSAASYVALFVYCVIATSSYITLEIYAGFRPEESQIFVAKIRTWINTHTDQVIILGSLILGFWLIGNSIYLIVT